MCIASDDEDTIVDLQAEAVAESETVSFPTEEAAPKSNPPLASFVSQYLLKTPMLCPTRLHYTNIRIG
jgi:hypothetical protein